jgi:hypothetical protein
LKHYKEKIAAVKGIGPVVNDEHLYYASQSDGIKYIRISHLGPSRVCIVLKKEAKDIKLMLTYLIVFLSLVSNKRNYIDLRAKWRWSCMTIGKKGLFYKMPNSL